jgi:hypothetical protein
MSDDKKQSFYALGGNSFKTGDVYNGLFGVASCATNSILSKYQV